MPKDLKMDEVVDDLIDFYKVNYWMYLLHAHMDDAKISAMIQENKQELEKWYNMFIDPKYYDREYAFAQIKILEAELDELTEFKDVENADKVLQKSS